MGDFVFQNFLTINMLFLLYRNNDDVITHFCLITQRRLHSYSTLSLIFVIEKDIKHTTSTAICMSVL